MICLYVLVAFVAVGNLAPARIATESDYALAAAAQPFLGSAGFKLIAVAAVVSTASAINATLYGAAKFTFLMARHGELPEPLGRPIWDRPIGGLLATTLGTLVIVNTVNLAGISLMGSAGFLIIFGAVNLAAIRLLENTRRMTIAALAGAIACIASLAALITYAATHIPTQLGVLAAQLGAALLGEALLRRRRATNSEQRTPRQRHQPGRARADQTRTSRGLGTTASTRRWALVAISADLHRGSVVGVAAYRTSRRRKAIFALIAATIPTTSSTARAPGPAPFVSCWLPTAQ